MLCCGNREAQNPVSRWSWERSLSQPSQRRGPTPRCRVPRCHTPNSRLVAQADDLAAVVDATGGVQELTGIGRDQGVQIVHAGRIIEESMERPAGAAGKADD